MASPAYHDELPSTASIHAGSPHYVVVSRIKADQLKRYFLKRLEQLGVQVTVRNQEKASTLPT
jgi:hypothetical protein